MRKTLMWAGVGFGVLYVIGFAMHIAGGPSKTRRTEEHKDIYVAKTPADPKPEWFNSPLGFQDHCTDPHTVLKDPPGNDTGWRSLTLKYPDAGIMVVFRHNRTRIDPEALHFERVEFYDYDKSGKTPLEWDVAVSLLECKVRGRVEEHNDRD